MIPCAQVKTVKGFEALSLLRELSTPPQILEKSGLSLFQEAGVVIPKSRQLGPLAASAALTPVAGAHLQQVCCLPPPGCCACLSTADVQGQGVLGSAGRVSQLGRGRRGRGLSPRVTPTWAHTSTESLCLHLVSWQWDGQGQGAPSTGRVEPKLCKGCVEAACTSHGCKRVRNGGFVYIPVGSSFPLPSLFEVSTERHRMNILGLSDMALFCSSSTSAPPQAPWPVLLTSGLVLESLADAKRAGHLQPERRRPEGWEPPWLSLRRRKRWSSPGWHQTCKAH